MEAGAGGARRVAMVGDVLQLEPKLHEVLQRSTKAIGSTRGALYLSIGGEPYELVTHYGYTIAPRRQVNGNDLIVSRLVTRRSPFWVNGANSDQRFYEVLYHSGTDAMLIVPLLIRGQLVGFLDLRDKGDKQPFGTQDLAGAKEIVLQLLELFAQNGLFAATGFSSPSGGIEPSQVIEEGTPDSVERIIEKARQKVERDLIQIRNQPKVLTDPEVAAAALALPTILNLQGVVIAGFTAFGHLGNIQHVASRGTVTEAALKSFDAKLQTWAKKQGIDTAAQTRATYVLPFGEGTPIQPQQLVSVLSAPVKVDAVTGLVLSVAFDSAPNKDVRQALETYLNLMQRGLYHAMSHFTVRTRNQRIAERLLEPDFQRYPTLVDHGQRVALLADQFAQFIGLPPPEVESIRLAAFLHDVGMRLLDYRRLYKKPNYTEEDAALAREHCMVGASIIADSPLGEDIAFMVLCHHERPDGHGYPKGLTGEQIPLGSRIIRICDSFDAMTSLHSYQPPVPESTALTQIIRLGGAEYDLDLARRFNEMLVRASTFGME